MGPCEPHEGQQGQVQGAAPGSGQFQAQYRLDRGRNENSPEDKDLEMLVNEKLHITSQCVLAAQKAKFILGCNQTPPLCSCETAPEVLHPALGPQTEGHGSVEAEIWGGSH